jgi:hypothetical protein
VSAIRTVAATAGCAVLLGLAVTGFVRAQLGALEAAAASVRTSPPGQTGNDSGQASQHSEVCLTASTEASADTASGRASASKPGRPAARQPASAKTRPSKSKSQVERGSFLDQLDRGITKVREGRYEIDRRTLDLALNNLARLAGAVRVAPDLRDGKPVGFRLFAIAADGPFAKLGLVNEDVLVSINHLNITTAEQVLDAYGKLKTAKHLVLGVLRGGRKIALEYTIR